MDPITKKSFLIAGGIILFLILYSQYNLCDCKKRVSYANVNLNQDLDLDSIFRPIDSVEVRKIKTQWQDLNLSSDSFNIKSLGWYSNTRQLFLIEHYSDEHIHYGAVIPPNNYDKQKRYPLFVWAKGLNQVDPSVNILDRSLKNFISKLENHFIIIPSYRGQALVVNQRRFCSDGFFGDAFDGATDDALRFLSVTKIAFEGIDSTNISVLGISRGGTVALLMGARDTTIANVISIAGPANFYSKRVYYRYGKQYKYQFLSTSKSLEAIREKMIKSSPIYFIDDYQNALLLIHGKKDSVVPVSEARNVMEAMKGRENFTSIILDGGHEFHDWNKVFDWIENNSG